MSRGPASEEEPLLNHQDESAKLNPDCPGCKVSHLRHPNAKAPYKLLLCMGTLVLSNALPISVLYPFVYFMVKDFHVAKSEEDIGYYAGWIGSSFMAGRAVTGLFWGAFADRYGRKPTMYLGALSVLIFNTLFGLSTSFQMALITRFLLGSFNGMLGTVKAYASEICSEEHQALGVSVVGTVWGLGLIVGPALGGVLAQPGIKYPKMFPEGSLFARYPYLLQALCVSAFAILGLIVTYFLPETLHKNHTVKDDMESATKDTNTEEDNQPLWKNWPFIASTIVYCVWSLHDIAYTEIFSLWSVSPKAYGGLSFTSSDVGMVLAVSGAAMLIAQILIFPSFAKLVGAIGACRYGSLATIPLLIVYPYFYKLEGKAMYIVVFTASILKYITTVSTMTGSFILINNTVRQYQRGAANGLSLSAVSVFKAIGPASGGIVFAWAQTRRGSWFLPGDQLVFFFLNVFAFLTFISTFEPFLPSSANKLMEDER